MPSMLRGLGVTGVLAIALTAVPAAGAARIDGRAQSARRPVAGAPVTLFRALPNGGRAVVVDRATTRRDGTFALRDSGRVRSGAVVYLTVGEGDGVRLAAVAGPRMPRHVVVNERTTVAAGYGLAQFVGRDGIAGTDPGLGNAAAMAANLADIRTGGPSAVLEASPNGLETSTIRTVGSLSNLLVPCVREASACDALFALARPPGASTPRGTLEAVADIARAPWHHVAALFALARSGAQPYRPALSAKQRPDAWTVALRFDGDGNSIDGPGNMAIDARGNVWVSMNYQYGRPPTTPVCGSDLVAEFRPDGRYVPGSPWTGGGLSGAGFGITLDPNGDVWVGNFGFAGQGCMTAPPHNSASKFAPDGRALSPPEGFTHHSISWPQGTVSDRAGTIWLANCGNNSVTRFPGGDPRAATNSASLGIEKPFAIAIDLRGRAYVTGSDSNAVAVLEPDGTPAPGSPITGGGLSRPLGITVDSRGNLWVANSGKIQIPCPDVSPPGGNGKPSVTLITNRGRVANFTGGGLTVPWGNAVDGADNLWVTNFAKQRLTLICGMRRGACPPGRRPGDPISPNGTGYGFDGLTRNTAPAVDPSGNVWVTNNWKLAAVPSNPGGYEMVVFVGAAPPLRTPVIGPPRG